MACSTSSDGGAAGGIVNRSRRQLVAFLLFAGVSLYAAIVSTQSQRDIRRIEPQVTQIVRATAVCRASILNHPKQLAACANRIKLGLSACRRDNQCRAAFLALMDSAIREGVVPGGNNPSGLAPGQGKPSGPETQPSPAPTGPDAAPSGLGSVTKGVDDTVQGVTDGVDQVTEELCTVTRVLLHLC
jgi:hypothetical protein